MVAGFYCFTAFAAHEAEQCQWVDTLGNLIPPSGPAMAREKITGERALELDTSGNYPVVAIPDYGCQFVREPPF